MEIANIFISLKTLLEIIGVLFILLAVLHVFLPKYLKWDKSLVSLDQANREIMKTHSFFIAFIAFMVFLVGLLCLASAIDLIETDLGRRICLGLAVFWLMRLFFQFFGYSSSLWKGKSFETAIHILACIFWVFVSGVFMLVFMSH